MSGISLGGATHVTRQHKPVDIFGAATAGAIGMAAGAAVGVLVSRAFGASHAVRGLAALGLGVGILAGAHRESGFVVEPGSVTRPLPPQVDVLTANEVKGITPALPSKDDDELRIVTINVHMASPQGFPLGDEHERIETFEDVGAYVRKIDADVVLVQEVNDDPAHEIGVPRQFDELKRVLGATDAVYGPAIIQGPDDAYGDAIFTRNGVTIERDTNVALPWPDGPEPRALVVAEVRTPDGKRARVGNLHLDHHRKDTDEQAGEVARITYELATSGSTSVKTRGGDIERLRGNLPIIVGGDWNSDRDVLDPILAPSGLRNALDSARVGEYLDAARGGDTLRAERAFPLTHELGRLDHFYASDEFEVRDYWVDEVPKDALQVGESVTDHRAVVVDVALRDR